MTINPQSQCLGQERKKYFAPLLIWRQNPQKSQIFHWVHKFQTIGSENNLKKKKAENPRSGRKLTARCPDNVDAQRFYRKESEKAPMKMFFHVHCRIKSIISCPCYLV